MEKSIQKAISNIALDKLLGNVISDNDLLEIRKLQDKSIVWNLLLKEQTKIKKTCGKINSEKAVNDIYNMQLLYWTICEVDIDDIRKKEFYDSLKMIHKTR